jgi:hypothetical protein
LDVGPLLRVGLNVAVDPEQYPSGRYARLADPEAIESNCGSPWRCGL